jgi:hypothetical protein
MPKSIFDLRLYGTLKRWHEEYGLKVSLYCINEFEGFNIQDFPNVYADELSENKEWLRFGFHSSTDQPFLSDRGYRFGFANTVGKLKELDAGITNIIRLHSWLATSEQKNWLASQGIEMIFIPYVEDCYLGKEEFYVEDGLKHQVTKCWIEKMRQINEKTLNIGEEFISCFTHEWCFDEQVDRIEKMIGLYSMYGYIFI